MESFLWDQSSLGNDVYIKPPENWRKRNGKAPTYASFGDNGTTASVNEYGNIIQICRFLGFGSSGFLCVDPQYSKPHSIQSRAKELMGSSESAKKGLYLDMVNLSGFQKPSVGYMYDRWPRYEFKREPLSRSETGPADQTDDDVKPSHTSASERMEATEKIPSQPGKLETSKAVASPAPLYLQYFCSGGTVFQKYLLRVGESEIPKDWINWEKELSLIPDICIRSLDFLNDHEFDNTPHEIKNLSTYVESNNLVITHFLTVKDKKEYNEGCSYGDTAEVPIAAALVVSPFVNGKPVTILNGKHVTLAGFQGQNQLDITIAYTLRLMFEDSVQQAMSPQINPAAVSRSQTEVTTGAPSSTHQSTGSTDRPIYEPIASSGRERLIKELGDWTKLCATEIGIAKQRMEETFCANHTFRKVPFSSDPRLDFAFRRNLDQILSVCSIPVSENFRKMSPPNEKKAVAITCGDIAGHRITSRANLSVIQLLCSVYDYLAEDNISSKLCRGTDKASLKSQLALDDQDSTKIQETNVAAVEYAKHLRRRVLDVLQGHVVWVCTAKSGEPGRDVFAAHYWPNGYPIKSSSSLFPPSLIDIPLQLLKILEYLNLGLEVDSNWIREQLQGKVYSWIEDLHASNKSGTYAFQRKPRSQHEHPEEVADPKYCLTDHVMISMALKCVEMLQIPDPNEDLDAIALDHSYSADDLSASFGPPRPRKGPGELTSRQAWLHYTFKDVRRKTLKRLTTVNPNSDQRMFATSRWPKITRFLLHSKDTYLFFAANMNHFDDTRKYLPSAKRIPKTRQSKKTPEDLWKHCDDRWVKLLDAQAAHDEFHHMDWDKPLWYALLFVLRCTGRCIKNQARRKRLIDETLDVLLSSSWYNGLFPGLLRIDCYPLVHENAMERDDYWFSSFEIPNVLWTFRDNATAISEQTALSTSRKSYSASIVNQNPRGTGQHMKKHFPSVGFSGSKNLVKYDPLSDDWLHNPSVLFDFSTTIVSGSLNEGSWRTLEDLDEPRNCVEIPEHSYTIVIDVPKGSQGQEIFTTKETSNELQASRSVWSSKKRIIWILNSDKETENKVCRACSKHEQRSLMSFFRRHIRAEKYFLDRTSTKLNEWETELHFSFLKLSEKDEKNVLHLIGQTYVVTVSMSFRFSGDLSDRHWTCYFLERGLGKIAHVNLVQRLNPPNDSGIPATGNLSPGCDNGGKSSNATAWQQRKVLELMIYNKMLEELYESSDTLLRKIKALILNDGSLLEGNAFDVAMKEGELRQKLSEKGDYFSIAASWRKYIQILDMMERNLTLNLEEMKQWDKREADRRTQQPRWTDRDQRNHFSTIVSLTFWSKRWAREIERSKKDVQAFRTSLPEQLDSIRGDMEFRGSQSINLFTYVTVIFLPLGFATGLLSMNGGPDHSLLMNLVILSLAALGVTLVTIIIGKYHSRTKTLVNIVWKFTAYCFFHIVIQPIMRVLGLHGRHQSSPAINQQQDMRQQTRKKASKLLWIRRRYAEITNFSYKEAVLSMQNREKSSTPKGNDGISTDSQPVPSSNPNSATPWQSLWGRARRAWSRNSIDPTAQNPGVV